MGLVSTHLLGPASIKRCPVCGATAQSCGSKGHVPEMIREVKTAGGNIIADRHIWEEMEMPGSARLLYAPGDVVAPADAYLVGTRDDPEPEKKSAPKPQDKALRGPRDKVKE